ncbi:MAG: ClpXP protease specificity-enhancing factor SspB [Pseudomonadota bacterium]
MEKLVSKSNVIRYDLIVQNAMLSVVRHVLKETQENGLPSDHHFYLTYSTTAEGVEMPSHLLEKYPDEITIVLQHEFEDLKVNEDFFDVTLWFNNVPAHLKVPFKAIRAFFDPSVKFGLQFNSVEAEEEASDGNSAEVTKIPVKSASKDKTEADQEADANEDNKTNIISLDSFRKK